MDIRDIGTSSLRLAVVGILMTALTGCQELDGDWTMSCAAFAGDTLSFSGDRFTWDKFTDARRIDDEGRIIDPFPGFPKSGVYAVDGDALVLTDESTGAELGRFYLHEQDGVAALLTAAEHSELANGGPFPECPLQRSATP